MQVGFHQSGESIIKRSKKRHGEVSAKILYKEMLGSGIIYSDSPLTGLQEESSGKI